jgi:hypothetical protein
VRGAGAERRRAIRLRFAVHARGVVVEDLALASASITGPTSVDSRPGSPTFSSPSRRRACHHLVGDVVLHEQHARRRAALAGGGEGRAQRVLDHLFGSAEESAIIAFWPPVSAISTRWPRHRARPGAVDRARGLGGAGEGHAGTRAGRRVSARRRWRRRRAGTAARPGHAGFVQQLHRGMADQVGLLGRLGDHAVAGGQRGATWPGRSPAGSSTG